MNSDSMISNRILDNLISGHWKSLTRSQQVSMARELMTYRKARQEYEPGHGDISIIGVEKLSKKVKTI